METSGSRWCPGMLGSMDFMHWRWIKIIVTWHKLIRACQKYSRLIGSSIMMMGNNYHILTHYIQYGPGGYIPTHIRIPGWPFPKPIGTHPDFTTEELQDKKGDKDTYSWMTSYESYSYEKRKPTKKEEHHIQFRITKGVPKTIPGIQVLLRNT
jgi:hypothetical protein